MILALWLPLEGKLSTKLTDEVACCKAGIYPLKICRYYTSSTAYAVPLPLKGKAKQTTAPAVGSVAPDAPHTTAPKHLSFRA